MMIAILMFFAKLIGYLLSPIIWLLIAGGVYIGKLLSKRFVFIPLPLSIGFFVGFLAKFPQSVVENYNASTNEITWWHLIEGVVISGLICLLIAFVITYIWKLIKKSFSNKKHQQNDIV